MNEVMIACFNDSFKRAKREGKRADVVLWSMGSISGCFFYRCGSENIVGNIVDRSANAERRACEHMPVVGRFDI